MKKSYQFIGAALVALGLSACSVGPKYLIASYEGYADAYAKSTDQQMLYNLARVQNGHAPYFLQMGGITSQFSNPNPTSFSVLGTLAKQGITATSASLGSGFSPGEAANFTYTPLSGDKFSSGLLKPVNDHVLFAMMKQDFPTDLLLRVLVDQVEFYYPKTKQRVSLFNRLDIETVDNYADFLAFSTLLGQLNKLKLLRITVDEKNNLKFVVTKDMVSVLRSLSASNPAYRIKALDVIAKNSGLPEITFGTRTFMGVMYGMAFEAKTFDAVAKRYPDEFNSLPAKMREPVIRILATPELTEAKAASLEYAGKSYIISDKPGSFKNRFAFSTLQYLYQQITLDPSSLPVQQLIQVR